MKQRICLNMIVKDEAHVIERSLASIRPFITDWLIVDTGSSDGTQDIIRNFMQGVPGQLVERPWRNFGFNRSEAIQLTPPDVDYLFFLDADEQFVAPPGFQFPYLTHDAYDLLMHRNAVKYHRRQLVRRAANWRFEGVLHEYVTGPENPTASTIPGVYTDSTRAGARSRDPETYRKDAEMLLQAVQEDPSNSRNVFYLAQSYRDALDPEQALHWYTRRSEMGGWIEEVWYAMFQIAQSKEKLGRPWSEVMAAYLNAYNTYPARAEALYEIGMHYQREKQWALAHLFLERAAQIPAPAGALFLYHGVYDYHAAIETAVAEYYLNRHQDALNRYAALLKRNPGIPESVMQVIRRNQELSEAALAFKR